MQAEALASSEGSVMGGMDANARRQAGEHPPSPNELPDFDQGNGAKPSATFQRSRAVDPSWPVLDSDALHGLAGDFVRTIEPHSEADPVGVLVQFLVGVGSVIGRGPHFRAEADEHHLNLFAVLVGATSKGRKGTALGHVL